jgi:hypothetical protein
MTKRRTIPALLAALGLGATAAAWAEQPAAAGQPDMQKQIEALQAQIAQLQAQQAQRATAPAYTAKDVDATVSSVLTDANRRSQLLADSGGVMAGWENGFHIRSADGNYDLQPYFQFDFRWVFNATDNAAGSDDTEVAEGFEIRRMKMGFKGHALSPKLKYDFRWATDRNSGNPVLENAYVQYAFADNMALKVGQWKDNVWHEETTSSTRQLAVDRSLLNEMLAGGETDYVQGIALIFEGGPIRGEVSYHDGANSDNTNFQDVGTNFGVSGRAEGLLMGEWRAYDDFTAMGNKKNLLVVGAGFDWTQSGDTNVFYHTVDGQFETNGGLGVYAAYIGRYVDLGGGAGGNDSVYDWGLLGQVGFMLDKNWEVFGRIDWTMLDDDFIPAGAEDNVWELTAGVNYYIRAHNAKISVDVTWLPNGSPENHPGIGILGQTGDDDQFLIRGQFQLLL